jgi:hypothetical protein
MGERTPISVSYITHNFCLVAFLAYMSKKKNSCQKRMERLTVLPFLVPVTDFGDIVVMAFIFSPMS